MPEVTTQVQNQIVRLMIADTPARNAIGFSMVAKLQAELAKISELCEQEPIACVIIEALALEGKSQKIWLSGGHLKDLYAHRQNPDAIEKFFKAANQCLQLIRALPVPVIMQQDGWALGGGAEFVLAGDLRFATDDSGLDFKQLKIGLPTGFGGTGRLVQLLGLAEAQHILLTSQTLTAKESKKKGLFHEVFGSEKKLAKHVAHLAESFCHLENKSLRAQKAMLRQYSSVTFEGHEFDIFKDQLTNETFQNFLKKFSAE